MGMEYIGFDTVVTRVPDGKRMRASDLTIGDSFIYQGKRCKVESRWLNSDDHDTSQSIVLASSWDR